MRAVQYQRKMTVEQELLTLEKRAVEMEQGYQQTHEVYYLIMLKAIAKKQELLQNQVSLKTLG